MASPERQAIIRSVYEDPETGFGSLRETYQQTNSKDPGIRYVDVKSFLDRYQHRQTQARYKGCDPPCQRQWGFLCNVEIHPNHHLNTKHKYPQNNVRTMTQTIGTPGQPFCQP